MDPFNDEYFMKQALVEARSAAEEGEVPVGAVIVCNNQIIARAPPRAAPACPPRPGPGRPPLRRSPRPQPDGTSERPNRPCRDISDNGGSRRLRSQVSDRMQPLRDGGTMRDVCRSNRMVATKQDRLRSDRRKKRLPAIRTESLTSKSDSQKRGS